MKPLLFVVIFLTLLQTGPASAEVHETSANEGTPKTCSSTKEYITALEFLRSHSVLKIPEEEARRIAMQVATGCDGAAGRFVHVSALLLQAELSGKDSIKTGLLFVKKTDAETSTFVTVFKHAFLAEELDLDVKNALNLALEMSTRFNGDAVSAREDFEKLLRFCSTPGGSSDENLDLPKPRCASWAVEIAKIGEPWEKGISQTYIDLFKFLRSDRGPLLPAHQAVSLATELMKAGPSAGENFIQAYRYGVASRGLDLSAQDAIAFARKLAFTEKSASPVTKPSNSKN